ncbi:unnamed protein product [Trichobilharzia szidati]|nr:unnamed protein product [Trichobilharzia szidati]
MTKPLDFDFGSQILPQYKEYQLLPSELCSQELNQFYNQTWLKNITEEIHSTMEQLNRPCEKIQRFEWMLEREYFVAITMGLLACFGLTGNLLSCIVIITHLLKFSGTFILFVFLSLADSLVVIMQTIDAYRNSVAVDFYTLISLEDLSHPSNVWRRDWNCKLFLYFWHLGLQLSAWLVMALSIDRYASLKQLNMLRSRSTLHYRAWLIGGGILIFLAFVNLPFLIYVKSVIYEMPCGHSHFCIFMDPTESKDISNDMELTIPQSGTDELDGLHNHFINGTSLLFGSNLSTDFNQTTDCKQLLAFHSIFTEPLETKHVKTTFSIARHISIWLSRQHLIIFGFIPYTVTIIFNLLLIHYLRTLPWFYPKDNFSANNNIISNNNNHKSLENNSKHNSGIMTHLNKFGAGVIEKFKVKKNREKLSSPLQPIIPCSCVLRAENNPIIIGSTSSYPPNKRKNTHKIFNNFNDNTLTAYYSTSGRCIVHSQVVTPHTWDGTLNCSQQINSNDCQLSSTQDANSDNSKYSCYVSTISNNNSQSQLFVSHSNDNDECKQTNHAGNTVQHFNGVQCCSNYKYDVNNSSNTDSRKNTDIHILLRKHKSNSCGKGWFVGQTRTTVLLLAVTFTFIGLTLPYLIYVELKQFNVVDLRKGENYRPEHMAEELCRFLFFINNGLTFFIYMTGRQFRRGFYRLIHRIKYFLTTLLCRHSEKQNRWYSHPPYQNHTLKILKPGKHYSVHHHHHHHHHHQQPQSYIHHHFHHPCEFRAVQHPPPLHQHHQHQKET